MDPSSADRITGIGTFPSFGALFGVYRMRALSKFYDSFGAFLFVEKIRQRAALFGLDCRMLEFFKYSILTRNRCIIPNFIIPNDHFS